MKKRMIPLLTLAALASSPVMADKDFDATLTNLTNSIYFTPLLMAAHNDTTYLYQSGMAASSHLQAMAEGGDISGLSMDLAAVNADVVENPAGGLLAPGASTMASFTPLEGNDQFSLVAMMLPTNDGFVGLNSLELPSQPGTYTYYLNAYDAGTEANDELIVEGGGAPGTPGIPADPSMSSGTAGTGVTNVEHNEYVHIHRGTLGDADLTAGSSDLSNSVHRWLNPVAKLVITIK